MDHAHYQCQLHSTVGFVFETHTHKLSLFLSLPLSSLTKILFLCYFFFDLKKKMVHAHRHCQLHGKIWLHFWRLRKLCRFWIVGVSTRWITYLFFTYVDLFYIRGLCACVKETFQRLPFRNSWSKYQINKFSLFHTCRSLLHTWPIYVCVNETFKRVW